MYRWEDLLIYKGFKECRDFPSTARTVTHLDYPRRILVRKKNHLRWYSQPPRCLPYNPFPHTGFNQIDLPQYTTYEMLRQQLLLAINEGGEGFGFA